MAERRGTKMNQPGKSSGYSKNIVILGLVSLFTDMANEVILRTIPLFLANVLGVRTSVIGFVEGVAESVSTLLKIISGRISDISGRRKPLTVLGYSLSSLSKPFLYFAASWPAVFLVRFADRVGKGIRTAPRDALIADSASTGEMGKAFGLHRTLDPLGAVFGTAIAGFIVLWHGSGKMVLDRSTFHSLVLLSLIPAAISLALLVFGVKEPANRQNPSINRRAGHTDGDQTGGDCTDGDHTDELHNNEVHNDGGNTDSCVKPAFHKSRGLRSYKKGFIAFLFLNVLFTLGNSSDAFLVLRAQGTGATLAGIFFLLAVFNIAASVISLPAGKLSDRFGRKKLLAFGWLLYSLVYLGFAYAKLPWHIWALYIAYGAYYGITDGVARAFVADTVDAGNRGTAYGLYNMAIGISALPASLIAGFLWDKIGPAAPFILGALLSLVAAVGIMVAIDDKTGASHPGLDPR